jgi:hypothetical protein
MRHPSWENETNVLEEFDSIGFYIVAVDNPVRITNPSIFYEDSKLIVNPDFGDPNECMLVYCFC